MNAPDKIYLDPGFTGDFDFASWDTEKKLESDVEYIRKDALLEWAKEKAEDYKGTANIRRSFEMMIRKIESL
jgi:hypothetical protein